MQKIIIPLICCLLPALVHADTVKIREGAPDRYVVTEGDTLWDISNRFFNDPWRWPQIWGINRDAIPDPHWIYPGDIITLNRASGTLHIGEVPARAAPDGTIEQPASPRTATSDTGGKPVATTLPSGMVRLSPRVRAGTSTQDAIPSIPGKDIEPFLSRPLIVDEQGLAGAPAIVGTYDQRVLLGKDDIAYVRNLPEDKGLNWQVYRAGKAFVDPDTRETLGYEATYLGNAEVQRFDKISTLRITHSIQEINKGDQLTAPSDEVANNYLPRAPEGNISARVISIYGGVSQAGQYSVITLNKGRRDGLENGHVLALYRKGEVLPDKEEPIVLPDMRYGLIFVFRTFEKLSYALVMQTRLPVQILDSALTP